MSRSFSPGIAGAGAALLFGATVGSVLDGFHSWSGTTSYPEPILLRAAWWTPLVFAVAYAALGGIYGALRARDDRQEPTAARATLGFAAFAALYLASGFLPASNLVKLVVLLAGAGALWRLVVPSPAAIVTGLVGSVVGPATEITLVHFGAFTHLQPDVAGILAWLPALYLTAGTAGSPFVSRVALYASRSRSISSSTRSASVLSA